MAEQEWPEEFFCLSERDVFELVAAVRESDISLFHLRAGELELVIRRGEGEGGRLSDGGSAGELVSREPEGLREAGATAGPEAPEATVLRVETAAPSEEAGQGVPPEAILVRSTIVGIFYRRASPAEPPYAEVGSEVTAASTVGLIEAMKVFTAVSAGLEGTVGGFLVDEHATVEHGQPLLWVLPARDH